MKYLHGKPQDFWNFLNSITPQDKVMIISHDDLDGIASAILLKEILQNKKVKIEKTELTSIDKQFFLNLKQDLIDLKITKLFISDLSLEFNNEKGQSILKGLNKITDVFLIDHHPFSSTTYLKNTIRVDSNTCATLAIYFIAREKFNLKKWEELISATALTEFSYENPENLKELIKLSKDFKEKDLFETKLGEITKKLNSIILYYKENTKKAYEFIESQNLKEAEKCNKEINKEVENVLEDFKKNSEFHKDIGLYFYYFKKNKFSLNSLIATKLGVKYRDKTIIIFTDGENEMLKASLRGRKFNLDKSVREAIKDLKNATGGGHAEASGVRFEKKDLEKFKENILSALKNNKNL